MKNRSLYAVLTRFGIIAAVLATLVLIAPAAQSASECALDDGTLKCNYAENGTDPVATFSATDADDDEVEWSLKGKDAGVFKIDEDSGVLTFKESPNYEKPTDGDESDDSGDQGKGDNVYKITVTATGATSSDQAVEITVTNVDEAGIVTFTQVQPQDTVSLTAELDDDDGVKSTPAPMWQWSRGASATGPWTDIAGATKAKRTPVTDDVGNYLRAVVSYTDKSYGAKTAEGVTDNPVEEETTANAAPSFSDLDDDTTATGVQIELEANENTKGNLGDPLTATDADNDILRYSIGGTDADCFGIDKTSGQLSLNAERDYETPLAKCKADGAARTNVVDNATIAQNNVYTVTVTATDPSNATGSATVTLTVKDVNEASEFEEPASAAALDGQKTLYIDENAKDANGNLLRVAADGTSAQAITYTAKDKDSGDTDAGIRYTVEGADRKHFAISGDQGVGTLVAATDSELFGAADDGANYEKKNSYSITIVATSGGTGPGDARKVSNVDRTRYSRLNVTIKVVNKEDKGEVKFTGLTGREPQEGKSVTATLDEEDGGVTDLTWQWYRGNAHGTPTATAVTCPDLGSAASTTDAAAWQKIEGATSPVYTPSSYTFDHDGDGNDDSDVSAEVGYCLRATASYKDSIFTADADPDQTGNQPDHDLLTADNQTKETVHGKPERVVQKDDPANTAPKFPDDNDPNTPGDQDPVRSVKENAKDEKVGDPVAAEDTDLMEYSISDTDNFEVDKGGQITTKVKLDYEALPEDNKTYTVVVTAIDPSGATGSTTVTINVTDENDPAEITGDDEYTYAENGTASVATFTATDQDGDDIEWSLGGVDAGTFEIDEDSGVLTFKDSPSFEDKKDKDENDKDLGDQGAGDNKYQIKVIASGGSPAVDGEHDVEIEVTDVDEPGTVSFSNPQPQVTQSLTASFKDDDGKTKPTWQWSRGSSADGPWTDIAGATTASRTPVGDDIGSYLRAVVSYTDRHGSQTAEGVTDNPVEGETLANAAPEFTDTDADTDGTQVTREINENVKGPVGKPIEVTDDDGDVLLYTLTGGADKDCFTIGRTSAQLSLNAKRDFENPAGDSTVPAKCGDTNRANGAGNDYVVEVTATDPSGAATAQTVTVKIQDVNEEPVFVDASTDTTQDPDVAVNRKTLYIDENDDEPAMRLEEAAAVWSITYDANDSDGTTKDTATTYKVEGADAKYFYFTVSGGTGTLLPVTQTQVDDTTNYPDVEILTADYEKKSSYSITIVAETSDGDTTDAVDRGKKYGRLDVTIKVVDGEDDGEVTLNAREPQEGKSVTASLSDPDGGETGRSWTWWRGDLIDGDLTDSDTTQDDCAKATDTSALSGFEGWKKIKDATSPVYTPSSYTWDHDTNDATDQVGYCLRARVEYTDNIANTTPDNTDTTNRDESKDVAYGIPERAVQYDDPANTAPKFPDDNDPNMAGNQPDALRSVKENAKDANVGIPVIAEDKDLLMYFISDTDNFKVDNDGQISTAVELDYEALPEDDKTYTVVLTARDPSLAEDTINVIITVLDEDDTPVISPNFDPTFDAETAERSVAENSLAGAAVGDPVAATDRNTDTGDVLTYTLSGDDAASFDIDSASGQISVGADTMLDYESDTTSYSVTVTVTDSTDLTDTIDVTITVTDVNDAPTFAAETTDFSVDENSAAGTVVGSVTADDEDADDTLKYTIAASAASASDESDDSASFAIDEDTGEISVAEGAMLDYETKSSYMVTVTATDPDGESDTIAVTITLNDLNEAPMFDADTAELSVDENSAADTPVGDPVDAYDDDGDTLTYTISGSVANGSDESNGSNGSDESNGSNGSGDSNGSNGSDDPVSNGSETSDSGGSDDSVSNGSDDPVSNGSNGSDESNGSNGSDESNGSNGSDESNGSDDPAPSFTIDSATGQISVAEGAMLDHEMKDSYTVVVTATDSGGLTDTVEVTISINDVNEAPMFDAETAELSVDENSEAGTNVGDAFMATDVDGDTLTYSLSGDDAASFAIDSASGQISVAEGTMLDYESDTTSYSVTVTASDDGDLADTIAVTITVSDVKESVCRIGGAVNSEDGDGVGLDKDCQTLLGVMDELMGDGTGTLNWSAETPISEWDGVASGIGRVYRIHLPDKGLAGTIPAGLNGLDALERLTLRDNDLTGEIPDLSDLDNLERLNLKGNMLSGSIPATLGDMESLDYLWLHSNDLTGEIPAELGNASMLRQIRLNDNMLSGAIPGELGQIARLRYLVLNQNQLTGSIPAGLGMAKNLKQLYLHNNMLTGSIPAELGGIIDANGQSVRRMNLRNNDLSGDIPAELGALVDLTHLWLSGNMLTGCIPAAISDAAQDAALAGLSACAAAEDDGNGNGSDDGSNGNGGNGSGDSNGNGNGSGDSNGNGNGS